MERTKMPNLWNGSKGGYEPGLTWLRVQNIKPSGAPVPVFCLGRFCRAGRPAYFWWRPAVFKKLKLRPALFVMAPMTPCYILLTATGVSDRNYVPRTSPPAVTNSVAVTGTKSTLARFLLGDIRHCKCNTTYIYIKLCHWLIRIYSCVLAV